MQTYAKIIFQAKKKLVGMDKKKKNLTSPQKNEKKNIYIIWEQV